MSTPPTEAAHSAESGAGDLHVMEGETVTAFALRRILHDAWVAGHDAACTVSLHPCWHHASPHADRPTPPAARQEATDADA
jgi:hypothetical protein